MVPQPKPPRCPGFLHIVPVIITFSSFGAPAIAAQTGPRILHDGLRCVLSGEHLILQALIEPQDGVMTVKAYFRANVYTQFYYVEMTRSGERYQGVLPKPSPEIDGLHYYIEAMDSSFNSVRTAEFTPQVVAQEASCREQNPTPAAYLDGPGSLTVGSTGSGPSLPAGFLPEGIVGTIEALGRSTGGGGGGLLIGGVAAGGAAVGAGILAGGGDDNPGATTTVVGGVTTTAATTSVPVGTTSTVGSSMVTACFETSPAPPRIPVGGSVRFDASCSEPERELIRSYDWNFNDGRGGREGRVVNRVYSDAGVFGTVLTVTTLAGDSDTFEMDVIVESGPLPPGGGGGTPGPTTTVPGDADLAIVLSGPGAAGVGVNVSYTINYVNNGPDFDPSVSISTTFSAPSGTTFVSAPGCSPSGPPTSLNVFCPIGGLSSGSGGSVTITVRFVAADTYFINANINGGTSDPVPGNNGGALSTVASLRTTGGSPLRSHLVSGIITDSGGTVRATLAINGAETQPLDNSAPARVDFLMRRGRNVISGYASAAPLDGSLWSFDFRNSEYYQPGSLEVQVGDIVLLDAHRVVLRLSGREQRVRIVFHSSP